MRHPPISRTCSGRRSRPMSMRMHVIERERRPSLSSARWALFLLLFASPAGANPHAQAVRVQLIDGRSGHPIAGTCVNVWIGEKQKAAMSIPTDKEGVASLRLTDEDTQIDTQRQSKAMWGLWCCKPHGEICKLNSNQCWVRVMSTSGARLLLVINGELLNREGTQPRDCHAK